MLIKGSDLTSRQREQVLAAFVHRDTIENARRHGVACMNCANIRSWPYVTGQALPDGPHVWTRAQWHKYHISKGAIATTDQEWLRKHAFHFVKDGSRLHARRHAAEYV
jgi:hypothetical protein